MVIKSKNDNFHLNFTTVSRMLENFKYKLIKNIWLSLYSDKRSLLKIFLPSYRDRNINNNSTLDYNNSCSYGLYFSNYGNGITIIISYLKIIFRQNTKSRLCYCLRSYFL